MKEFVLSFLSRGCSHVVRTDGSAHCGRLEICFEPEDYFTWKSQPTLLRLSSSGHLLSGVEPTPPKTYTTRRGPLILYSEEFALSSYQADKVIRKGRAFRSFGEEAEIQLHSLRDLTEAALAYSAKRVKQARLGGHSSITQPLLPVPKPSAKHSQSHRRLGDEQKCSFQLTEGDEDQASSRAHGNASCPRPEQTRYHPRFLCVPQPPRPPPGLLPLLASSTAPRRSLGRPHLEQDAHPNSKPKGPDESPLTRDRTSFRTDVETPRVQMSPVPESDAREELTGWCKEQKNNMLLTPQVAEHLTGLPKDLKGQWNRSAMGTGGEEDGRSFKPACADLSLGSDHLSKDSDRKHTEGGWQPGLVKRSDADLHARKVIVPPNSSLNVHHLPPIKQELSADTKEHGLKVGTSMREIRDSVPRLPDIHLPDFSAEDPGPKSPAQTLLKKVFVLLPPTLDQERLRSLPEEEEVIKDVLSGEAKEKDSIRAGDERPFEPGRGLKAEQDQLIWFEPDEDKEHQTTLGPLPPFVGRRGLGKQCSMALYRQDPHDPADQVQSEPGITRGSLPLELRECQKGGVLGTLIMGPAGEIIRLSFWDPLTDTEDHPALEDAMREHVLRVMTSDGVLDQPWTISMQDQTQTGEKNDSKPKAKQSSKKQATFNQSDSECSKGDDNEGEDIATPRAPDGSIKAAEKAEDSGPDERRRGVYLHPPSHLYAATAPEKRSEKIKRSAENQPHSNGEDIKKQMRGRTRSQQPEGRARPGSPKPTSVPASNPRKTNLSTPEATDKAKPMRKTEAPKERVKTWSRKAGGTDHHSNRQMRKVKEEEDQHEGGATENKDEEEKRVQIDTGTETQETRFTAETSPGVVPKKNTKAAGDKSKTEPNTSQNLVKKVKKSSKGQAAFVVGKPRSSQDVQPTVKKTPGAEKRSSNRASAETKEISADDRCRISPAHGEEISAGAEPGLDDDQSLQEPRVSPAGLVQVSREAGPSLDDDQISDLQEGYAHGAPSRSPSCASKNSSGTWSYRRSSVTSDTDLCSPVPSSITRTSPRCAEATRHQAASTPRSEPTADPKASTEATNQRDSKGLAEKAERRRLEVERKRKEKEEEKKRQQERDEREERMRRELEEEQKQRAEQARLRKLRDEEERRRQAERETERQRREQAETEKDRRRQEEKKRLLERLQRERLEEEARRAAELRRQQQEEEARREEEWRRLEEMEENERLEYLRRQKEEEEERRKALEERRRAEEEAATRAEEEARLLAELYNRQRAALEQQLHFHRGLFVEAEGLDQTQDISRPWVFSYFSLMKVLGLANCNAL